MEAVAFRGTGVMDFEEALRVVERSYLYVIQKKLVGTGEWKSYGEPVRGKEAAYGKMNAMKERYPTAEFRVVGKNEADKYREGWEAHKRLVNGYVSGGSF